MFRRQLVQGAFLFLTVLFLNGSSSVAEERNFAGLLLEVNLEARQIDLAGNVRLLVSSKSRLYDRAGELVDLEAFAQSAHQTKPNKSSTVILAYYKAHAEGPGKMVVDWISLSGPIDE